MIRKKSISSIGDALFRLYRNSVMKSINEELKSVIDSIVEPFMILLRIVIAHMK